VQLEEPAGQHGQEVQVEETEVFDLIDNKVDKKTNKEYEEVKEDTVNGVEEDRDQEINEIDAEGHLEKKH
jgi:hypothetical protein